MLCHRLTTRYRVFALNAMLLWQFCGGVPRGITHGSRFAACLTPSRGSTPLLMGGLIGYAWQMAGHGNGRRRRSTTLGVFFAVTIVLLALAGGLAPSLLPGTWAAQD